jgi:AraC family transcriptional regulator of adaptative response/methylated-DNA-[protein]-cysteine methyltransferase
MRDMDEARYWKAVEERDAAFDGKFYFAVSTTGIFCRPSCSAKRAKRENVTFFSTADDAERGGFRACMRCRPTGAGGLEFIVDVANRDEEGDMKQMQEVAYREGVTLEHLRRKFKQSTGVSAKRFEEAKRIERFKKEVTSGAAVTEAIYAAGYGSSSRLYENADDRLGMTPAAYKRGGLGVSIGFTTVDTEFGKMLVARTVRGICSVTFADSDEELELGLRNEFPNAEIGRDDSGLAEAVRAIVTKLRGGRERVVLPLDIQATAFQIRVWDELSKIPYGETRSYGEVAETLGDRKKVRAVARACATNQVAILIPCHRVVASDGKLSGYRWGVERKRRLLEREKEIERAIDDARK